MSSVTVFADCLQALARVHVNLVDLLDVRTLKMTSAVSSSAEVGTFRGARALSDYTWETQKFFSRDIVKEDKLLKVLLRRIV